MPGLSVELPAMSEKDKQDIRWGIKNDVSKCSMTVSMSSFNFRTIVRSHQTIIFDPSKFSIIPIEICSQIDYIAASFVRKASDVHEIKEYVAELMKDSYPADYPHPKIISKIESTEVFMLN